MKYAIQDMIYFDDVDGSLHSVAPEAEDVHLTPTATLLLSILLENQGIITRDTLLDKVWESQGQQGTYNNLNQYLSILRRAFRQLGLDNVLVTVPRQGYCLNPEISVRYLEENDGRQLRPDETPPGEPPSVAVTERQATETPDPADGPAKTHQGHKLSWMSDRGNYTLGGVLMIIAAMMTGISSSPDIPVSSAFVQLPVPGCDVEALEDVRPAYVSELGKDFTIVKNELGLACDPHTRFYFFNHSRLKTDGLGQTLLVACVPRGKKEIGYCKSYLYDNWSK